MRWSRGRWYGNPEGGETITESYVNLIPTPQGGTHVNGLRSGLLASMREFCEFRNLLPRGIKLTPTISGTAAALCSL
jgi:DNA gyrase/topoisomerase IV subunit B